MQRALSSLGPLVQISRREGGGAEGWTVWRHVTIVLLFAAAYVTIAYLSGGERDPDHYFGEGRAIDVMSALFLSVAGSFAWACFLLRWQTLGEGRLFWMLLAVGFLFVALDEMLEFHENVDYWLRGTWVGWPPLFRNWNDVIVISYGLGGIALLARYWREIARLPQAFILLALGSAFYVLHTGIDSLVSNSAAKNLVEESAKLTATAFFALSMLAAFIAMLQALRHAPLATSETE